MTDEPEYAIHTDVKYGPLVLVEQELHTAVNRVFSTAGNGGSQGRAASPAGARAHRCPDDRGRINLPHGG
jgi:hypothetical protein